MLIFLGGLFFPGQIQNIVSQASHSHSRVIFAITLSLTFLLSVINFCYYYFLYLRSKDGEEISSATFLSLQLIILPIMLLASIVVVLTF